MFSALIGLVVAIFYMASWHMGAVEAVSLSILVGSSVDYCVHLVEGYLLMGKSMPAHITAGVSIHFFSSTLILLPPSSIPLSLTPHPLPVSLWLCQYTPHLLDLAISLLPLCVKKTSCQ